MGDDKKKEDITSIENISDWEHDEDEDLSLFDQQDGEEEQNLEARPSLDEIESPFDESSTSIDLDSEDIQSFENESSFEELETFEPIDEVAQEHEELEDIQEEAQETDQAIYQEEKLEITLESYPQFTLKFKVRNKKHHKDILRILTEFDVLNDENESLFQRALNRGEVLIPRISEFVAITISHKLRFFVQQIEMGFSEEIFTSQHEEKLPSLQAHEVEVFDDSPTQTIKDKSEIMLSNSSLLENFKIEEYIGPVSAEKLVTIEKLDLPIQKDDLWDDGPEQENQELQTPYFKKAHQELQETLRGIALHKKANAVIAIQYQHILNKSAEETAYHVIVTGTLVWAKKK